MNKARISPVSPGLEFCLSLIRGYAALSRRFDGRLGSWHGISFADFAILLQLRQAPDGRLRRVDLAGQLGLTASAVTRALIPLEKIGLVSRETDPNDGRVGYATLRAAGRRILDEALESAELISREVLPESGRNVAETARLLDHIAGR